MSDVKRPLSPHLSVYRWAPHMLVSILHRATGMALAAGSVILAWGLIAAASGPGAYDFFYHCLSSLVGRLVLFGVTWALMQHLMSGLRHLYMDTGGGFDLATSSRLSVWTLILSTLLTLVIWALGYGLI